jgi:hypothetical protein
MDDKISYSDLEEHQHLFTLAPSFILERMAKKNSNLVHKFKSAVQSHMNSLTDAQKSKLDIILNSDVEDLQDLLAEAYRKTKIKQYKILANPKYKEFIELNLKELRDML